MIPLTPRTSQHLIDWCHQYQTNGTVPQPGHIRFGIGVYQITQGMAWRIASPVRWQSFCAAAMHFIMCGEFYGASVAADMPETLEDFPEAQAVPWHDVLMSIGKAQQQIIYHPSISSGSTRASRFNREHLRMRLSTLVRACFSLTPAGSRESGCFDEMNILTGDLPAKG